MLPYLIILCTISV